MKILLWILVCTLSVAVSREQQASPHDHDHHQYTRSLWEPPPDEYPLFVDYEDLKSPAKPQAASSDPLDAQPHSSGSTHKDLYPMNGWDIAGISLATVGLMIAAGGGIGGGGILVPIYILVLGFKPKYGIPLSNITIFGGAISNMVLNVPKRHPLADRPLVDWDLILIMEPLTIGGALVGSFVNKVLPDWILAIALVALLSATAKRTLEKGVKSYHKETRQKSQEQAKMSELATLHENQLEEAMANESESLLADEDRTMVNEHAAELKAVLEEERTVSNFKVGLLIVMFVVVLAVNLLKGGGAFHSPVGIRCGSAAFWGASVFIFGWVTAVSLWARQYLIERWRLKAKIGYKYAEGDVEWDGSATIKYPGLCFFAGFFAGLFGVGGGIIKGPLMLEMGVHPLVASATSACMILFTSFTATTSFMVFGLLKVDYAFYLFVVGVLATVVGQLVINHLVRKYQRVSIITLSIGAVVALSSLLMGGQSLWGFVFPSQSHGRSGFCQAGD